MIYSRFESEGIHAHHAKDISPDQKNYSMHLHECHELFYFINGDCSYFVEGHEYNLSPGSIMLLKSGEAHHLVVRGNKEYERFSVHFSPVLLNKLDANNILLNALFDRPIGTNNFFSSESFNKTIVDALMHNLLNQLLLDDLNNGYKKLLFLSTLSLVLCELSQGNSKNNSASEKPPDVVAQAIVYINARLTEKLTLSQIAGNCFCEKSYLNAKFKQYTGATIWDYIIVKRLLLSRSYIKAGMKATKAAQVSGWNDYSAFFRQYKSKFGISPAEDKD